ncbi:glycosyltransferase family 39 protein [Candidatus Saccharibacteria bacterium]|nr:glycosyltransferase family 39 protein [Candidatus Saccharibacteria bacterium]
MMAWIKNLKDAKQPSWWLVGGGLALMIAFAIYFSLTIFSQTSLRLDEAQSLFQTNRDVPGVLNLVAQDVHVPGYHILLHYWQLLFGNDIFTARMMSLVFFVALIPATYALASYTFNRRVGLFAALLVTLSPFMDWYGSEARMYTMLALATVLHQLAFMKIYKEGKPVHWVWFTLTAIVGMYTHYFFAFVILTELFFFVFSQKQFAAKKAFRKFLIAGAIVAAAIAPWIYYVVQLGTASNTQPSLTEPSSVDLFNTYAQFIFGFQVDGLNTVIVSLWPIVVLLAFFALQANRKTTREVIFFVMAAVVPVMGAFIISVTVRPFFQSRYLIVALPALMIFVAWVLSIYPTRIRRALQVLLVIIIAGLFAVQAINPNTPVKEDYRDAVGYLTEKTTSQDVVVLAAPFTVYPTEYYYRGDARITTQPIWNRFQQGSVPAFDESKLEEEVKQNTGSYQTAWLMLSYDQGYNEKIKDYYDNHFERTSSREFSKDLWVYSYKIRYDPEVTLAD